MILSLRNLSLIFLDNGKKLGRSILTFLAVLDNMLEYVSYGDFRCIASIFQKPIAVKRLLHLKAERPDNISKLSLGFIIVTENPLNIPVDIGSENTILSLRIS